MFSQAKIEINNTQHSLPCTQPSLPAAWSSLVIGRAHHLACKGETGAQRL